MQFVIIKPSYVLIFEKCIIYIYMHAHILFLLHIYSTRYHVEKPDVKNSDSVVSTASKHEYI